VTERDENPDEPNRLPACGATPKRRRSLDAGALFFVCGRIALVATLEHDWEIRGIQPTASRLNDSWLDVGAGGRRCFSGCKKIVAPLQKIMIAIIGVVIHMIFQGIVRGFVDALNVTAPEIQDHQYPPSRRDQVDLGLARMPGMAEVGDRLGDQADDVLTSRDRRNRPVRM